MRLFLVDDDADLLVLLEKQLRHSGYEVISFQSSLAAGDFFKQEDQRYQLLKKSLLHLENQDIFIIDQEMPEKSGLMLIEDIRHLSRFQWSPILMLTASEDEGLLGDAIEAGVDYFLNKGAGIRQLLPQLIGFARKKAENHNKYRQRQLEIAAALVATIQHQGGNSLAKIAAYCFHLKRAAPDSALIQDYVQKLETEVDSLGGLIRKMAEYETLHLKEYAEGVQILDLESLKGE